MKYTIEGFNQEYALSLTINENDKIIKLDTIDLVILRYFVDFYPNTKKIEIDGKQYAWLAYNKVVTDLPLLQMDKRSISKRLNKMCKLEILTYEILENNQTMFGFGPNYEGLVNSRPAQKCQGLYPKEQPGPVSENTTPCTFENSYISINKSIKLNTLEKKEKEINKEISTSCNEVNTARSISLKDDERITPTPIRDICIKHIEQFTSDEDIQKLLVDYLDSRLHINTNLSEVSFKASLGTLKSAQTYCENPALLKYYTSDVILNATAGTYSQFKPILSSVYKKTNTSLESTSIVKNTPFGDTSICIPAESNLDLALDENGNPIKF